MELILQMDTAKWYQDTYLTNLSHTDFLKEVNGELDPNLTEMDA
jgi:hypothetical protein